MNRRFFLRAAAAALAAGAVPGVLAQSKPAAAPARARAKAKKTFLQDHPLLTSLFGGETDRELMAKAANSEFDGADAIAYDLGRLDPKFRNEKTFARIINAVNLPAMFLVYRNDKFLKRDDDARQEVLLTAADAGATMIDVMGDLYDPSPMEFTRKPEAVEKQKRLVDKIHSKGAEVVISSHTGKFLTTEQVLEHMKSLEARGADVVKLVQNTNTELELEEAIRTTFALRRELKVPFIHLCGGKFSRIHRFFGPALGVSIFFAVQRFESGTAVQPTIRAMRAVLDNLHWNINAM